MLKFLSKLFGSKSERDIKSVQSIVDKIKEEYEKLSSLSHDELRAKTADFKNRIKAYLADIEQEITSLKAEADKDDVYMGDKTAHYEKVAKLSKNRDKKLEEVLLEILPEAFAVVKDTARRLTENKEIEVTATDFDRELAVNKPNVVVEGDKAVWKNSWTAAGTEVTWNMVHYDVQLIGGIVLHQGKIARSEERRVGRESTL